MTTAVGTGAPDATPRVKGLRGKPTTAPSSLAVVIAGRRRARAADAARACMEEDRRRGLDRPRALAARGSGHQVELYVPGRCTGGISRRWGRRRRERRGGAAGCDGDGHGEVLRGATSPAAQAHGVRGRRVDDVDVGRAHAGGRGGHGASFAKTFVSEAVDRVVDRAIQLCGGLGVTHETPLGRFMNEVRAFGIYDGPAETHRWAIARRGRRAGPPRWAAYRVPRMRAVQISELTGPTALRVVDVPEPEAAHPLARTTRRDD